MATEKRLIDANALDIVANEDGIANGIWIGGRQGGQIMRLVLSALQKMIDNAPTVDAVEVVHGWWKKHNQSESVFVCSECGVNIADFELRWLNYCPNCGAKMDGDGNGKLD